MTAFQEAFDLGMNRRFTRRAAVGGCRHPAWNGQAGTSGGGKGVVYTKLWVADLILDLAGYQPRRILPPATPWSRRLARARSWFHDQAAAAIAASARAPA